MRVSLENDLCLQVQALQFNSLNSPHLLASGGLDSPVTIWNLEDSKKPTSYPALRVSLEVGQPWTSIAGCASVSILLSQGDAKSIEPASDEYMLVEPKRQLRPQIQPSTSHG